MRTDYLDVTATVFNIQTYSIHDGPGIRVTVFLKGCPLRCHWCANPESNEARPQLMTYRSLCTGCGQCVPVCPQGAVSITHEPQEDNSVKVLATTDRDLCTNCGKCVEACSQNAREISGKTMSVREVLHEVLKDRMFIEASGGGITVSGGECLTYPEFTSCLLYAAKEEGLHTAVESSSFADRSVIDKVFPYVDLALLDIKHMDPDKHRELTGVSNELILSNIRHIYHDLGVKVTVRVPVVPGCNDSDENIAATARFAAEELGSDVHIHLLPYHRLGESKNESLGRDPDMGIEIPSDEHMEHLRALAESFGPEVQVGG